MKYKLTCLALGFLILLVGCGGGSDSSSSDGTLTVKITDAKPVLPPGTEAVLITFDEVSVHKSGGGWISLPMAKTPYTIDLLQFNDGTTTEFVPPASLSSGTYTQVRIGVTSGTIRINGSDYPLDIPSSNLKTDKNFEFTVEGGGAVDLTVDFDLSQSIVVTGSGNYQLKPVLHLNRTQEAATIVGNIQAATFIGSTVAEVVVTWDKDDDGVIAATDEEYTRIEVDEGADPTEFRIYWLVPDESYIVQVFVGGSEVYYEAIPSSEMGHAVVFDLNGGGLI